MEKLFRITAHLEGWSYLILLGIAMPLKYIWNQPIAVQITGMIHGILFISYIILTYLVAQEKKWNRTFTMQAYLASLLPFATFYIVRKMKD